MSCGGCLASVTKAIRTLDPQAHVEADLENRRIFVRSDKAEASLLDALANAGYPAQAIPAGS
ncbi:heavy-metal-associated domain-containing protein [Microvirga sp. ACRRW]|nr:heavy-metal-associated domain-containing protein [Microvirga sp. ACRRW]